MKNRIYKFLFTLFFTCLFSNSQSDELNINASEVKVHSVSKIIFAQGNVEISDNKKQEANEIAFLTAVWMLVVAFLTSIILFI